MTIQELYASIGADYNDVKSRLMMDKLIIKFSQKFPADPSYASLIQFLEEKNYPEAFKACHTLKGVCANLGFKNLFTPVYELTEQLRQGNAPTDFSLVDQVTAEYQKTVAALNQFKAENNL